MTETVVCNLCGQDDTTTLAEKDRYGLATTVVECRGCGLRYHNPRMTAERYADFYRGEYRALIEQHMRRPYPLAELEADQWLYAVRTTQIVGRWLEPYAGGRVLDVGGSTGIVGRMCRARWGMTVTVIDPSPEELARARDCETICGAAEDVTFPATDVALLCRTIDHLRDPFGVLQRLRATGAGVLVVDAMTVDGWPAASRYKVDHPYAFTAETFRRMVRQAGWRIRAQWTRRGPQYLGLVCSPQE